MSKDDVKGKNELVHFQLPALLKILSTQLNVFLVGPAGSGKNHAAI